MRTESTCYRTAAGWRVSSSWCVLVHAAEYRVYCWNLSFQLSMTQFATGIAMAVSFIGTYLTKTLDRMPQAAFRLTLVRFSRLCMRVPM